jgi:HEAT repeat protein
MPSKDKAMKILTQAKQAAAAGDWALVSSHLATVAIAQTTAADQSQILDLALQVLMAGEFHDCWQVAKVLPALGQIAIDPLLAILQDDSLEPEVRWFAGRILGEFREAAVASGLAQCLLQYSADPDSELTEIVVQALSQMGELAIEQLTALLNTNKLAAVTALAQIRHSRTIPALLIVADDSDPQIRVLAIEALSSFHDLQIPALLIDKLTDAAKGVRQAAVTGLGLRADLRQEFQLVAKIQPLLWDVDLNVCVAAAIALGRLGDAPAATALVSCCQQPTCPEPLQRQIVRCLGWIDLPITLKYLQEILATPKLELIPEVIRAIGLSQQPLAIKILTDYLRILPAHYPIKIKQEIAVNLGNFSKTIDVKEVIDLLADPNEQVRWHAIYCLKQLDSDVIHNQLQQLSQAVETAPDLLLGIQQYLADR